jgi:TolA-binding protein
LDIFKELLKRDDAYASYYADTLYWLGELYSDMKRYDDAEKYFIESRNLYKQLAEKKAENRRFY